MIVAWPQLRCLCYNRSVVVSVAKETNMVYRMVTSIVIWVATTVMVLVGKLKNADLGYVLGAATLSTIATWWAKPEDS